MVTQTIKGLLVLTILSVISTSIVDAKIWGGGIRPSLLKRKLNYSSLQQQLQQDITTHIPTGNANDAIEKAVFCVRGGGANGPCIGIDLGRFVLCCFYGWLFDIDISCAQIKK